MCPKPIEAEVWSRRVGLQPGEPGWQLEQQRQELPCVEPEQQHAVEPEQQPRFPSRP